MYSFHQELFRFGAQGEITRITNSKQQQQNTKTKQITFKEILFFIVVTELSIIFLIKFK